MLHDYPAPFLLDTNKGFAKLDLSKISVTFGTTAGGPFYFGDYKKQYDSVARLLKLQNFRINRIKYYLNICIKHPKNDKFLKGWIARALQ